ncbi:MULTISPECIES: tetratricopeptide repeat protein [unclassified Microcoleus]|uniref:tetratricopeptide repeat protein n=1 Tax=unclassified Microcoleus TaxID=2642155 RepID=UPI002FD64AEE
MTPEIIDWDADLPPATAEEEYESLLRTLKRTNGFRLLFVECVPAEGERLITQVREDLSQKKIQVLPLDKSVYNFYKIIEDLPKRDEINILFVTGLEYSLYEYEQEKRELGWKSEEIYSYSWRGVPPVLINLNQQRERFRDNFNICFVFILPRFAVNYLIERAPDFFDWRSSLFKLSMDKESLQAESMQACSERRKLEEYLALTPEARKRELVRLQGLIDEDGQTPEQKAELFGEQALLYLSAEDYAKAIAFYDKALEFKPDKHDAWYNRGSGLDDLGRLEEAIAFYDKVLEFKPNSHETWYHRGSTLVNLGRLEEAIASYDKALEIKPDKHEAWYNRGIALGNLGRLEEEIASYDKALEIQPDDHEAWYNRGIALDNLGRWEEAIASYDKALEIQPDDHAAWYNRGIALDNLGRWEEAIASYDKALEFKPDKHEVWNNRGNALDDLGRLEEAISSYDKALEFKPDDHAVWYNRGITMGKLGRLEEAIASYDKALEFKPDKQDAWYNRGYALGNLGRLEETIASFDKALEFKPDKDKAWYNIKHLRFIIWLAFMRCTVRSIERFKICSKPSI